MKMKTRNTIAFILTVTLCFSLPQDGISQSKEEVKQKIDNINKKYKQQNIDLHIYDEGDYQLKEIPKELQQLSELRNLELDGNNLQLIPREIGKLQNLQRLFMSDNKIKFIPREVFMLPTLLFLKLNSNKIDLSISEFMKCASPNLEIQLIDNNSHSIPNRFKELSPSLVWRID
jgi:Leucine-rich repeat (LRR) protein